MAVELFTPRGLQIRDTADCKSALRCAVFDSRQFTSFADSILASGFRLLYPAPMFEPIAAQLTTAADKLAHLRRFL